jgi:hypothetical protein
MLLAPWPEDFAGPATTYDPRGNRRHLANALAMLGSFVSPRHRAVAEAAINDAARVFNWAREQERSAPLTADMSKRMQDIAKQAKRLRVLLDRTPWLADALYVQASVAVRSGSSSPRDMAAYHLETLEGKHVERLHAALAMTEWLAAAAGQRIRNRGGRRNSFTEFWGNARSHLARHAAQIMYWHTPGLLSGARTGPFAAFVGEIQSYATGTSDAADWREIVGVGAVFRRLPGDREHTLRRDALDRAFKPLAL